MNKKLCQSKLGVFFFTVSQTSSTVFCFPCGGQDRGVLVGAAGASRQCDMCDMSPTTYYGNNEHGKRVRGCQADACNH